jgi:hypothetical protein
MYFEVKSKDVWRMQHTAQCFHNYFNHVIDSGKYNCVHSCYVYSTAAEINILFHIFEWVIYIPN